MNGSPRPNGHFSRERAGSSVSSVSRVGRGQLYRRDSNLSTTSYVSDVEMAHDEVFSGPMSESIPTSNVGFANRRNRADSTASFTYYPDEEFSTDTPSFEDEAIIDDFDEGEGSDSIDDVDLENGGRRDSRRKSSQISRLSVEDPLLQRHDSRRSVDSGYEDKGRLVQKIYVESEDLTVVFAGFKTSNIGFIVYLLICMATGGLAYLLFRWIPSWKIKLVGAPWALADCSWIVVENQWGEFTTHDVEASEYDQTLSTVFGAQSKKRYSSYDEDDDPIMQEIRSLDYRYIRFIYHPIRDKFMLNSSFKDPAWTDVKVVRSGLETDDRNYRQTVFGFNLIDIKQKTVPQLLLDEAFHPFYVFQIASLLLWSLDEYYYYATCIFLISVVSITTTLIDTRATMKRLREISKFECDVRVLRNGFWRSVPSSDLVPGDIYEVSDSSLGQFPCDSLLLSGDVIVNESMLTGESVPVSKIPATNETLDMLNTSSTTVHPLVARHFLFSGTKIIRARRPQDTYDDQAVALGLVLRTGFNTTKGALVRSMLFPKPSGFKFYRDSFRYISVMACIAGVGFIASFINFIRLDLAWHLIIVRALDLITIVVPPALPATLTIGTNFALSRLKKKSIFCISPQRVNVGGKLDLMCFDKTGTLTEDGLDVLGLRIVHQHSMRFTDLYSDASLVLPGTAYERDPSMDYSIHKAALYTMATCHSLRVVDGVLVGDPLDVKMFEFTGWSFEEGEQKNDNTEEEEDQKSLTPSVARPPAGMEYDVDDAYDNNVRPPLELGIFKSFEFVSHLRRASVIIRQYGASGGDVYVKGAPECMKEICRPDSFPVDYEELLSFYTHRGFRVIAVATKHIPKWNWVKVQKMEREDAESDLTFVGFIIFENKLKEITTEILDELNGANIRTVMCTGDNILTAISVARECHLIEKTAHCFVPHFVEGDSTDPKARLSWTSVDNAIYELDDQTLLPLPPPAEGDASLAYDISNIRNYSLAVSGDVFRWVVEYAPEEIMHRMLACGQVFARMSPDEKHELVEKFQSIDYCCGFCGDGANDCGALKAADVGISLSEAEASVAAPFTSRVFDISCVPQVIREGRAALVTSFCCFKYMSLYSAIQFTSVSFLYASASNLGDFQFLFIDLLLILPIAIFMGWTGAFPVLSAKKPTSSLVSRKVLTPLLGQIVVCILIQGLAFKVVQQQSWYIPPVVDTEKSNITNSQNTTLFLLSCFQYILSGVVLSIGPPFRQSMAQNLPFVITIVAAVLFATYMLMDPAKELAEFMQLTYLSITFKLFMLVLAAGGFTCAYLAERHFFPWLARAIGKTHDWIWPQRKKKRKEFKVLLERMRF